MASLGSLVIEIAANTARLQGDLGKAVNVVERSFSRINSIARTLGVFGAGASLTAIAGRAIEMGDSLNKAAVKAGITGKSMSELAYVAKKSDIDIATLSTSIKKMQVALSDAGTGAKVPNEALRALGISIKDLQGLSADRQFEVLADRISKLKDPSDRARAATDLFGKSGADLLPAFEDGAKGIRQAREEAQKLGASFSDDVIKKLAEADDAIKNVKGSFEGLSVAITAKAAPSLSYFLEELSSLISGAEIPRLKVLNEEIRVLKESLKPENIDTPFASLGAFGGAPDVDAGFYSAEERVKKLEELQRRVRALTAPGRGARFSTPDTSPGFAATSDTFEDVGKAAAGFADDFTRAAEQVSKESADLVAEQIGTMTNLSQFNDQMLKDWLARDEKLGKDSERTFTDISEYALQAARNMQSAFADFLFDPFSDGLKGMLKGFIDVIRRMVAEAAAARFFDYLGGSSTKSGLGKALRGLIGFANGGEFTVGGSGGTDSQLVAFKATPGEQVSISKPGMGGGASIHQTIQIDARGSSIESVKLLQQSIPGIIRQSVDMARAAVRDDISRGVYA